MTPRPQGALLLQEQGSGFRVKSVLLTLLFGLVVLRLSGDYLVLVVVLFVFCLFYWGFCYFVFIVVVQLKVLFIIFTSFIVHFIFR